MGKSHLLEGGTPRDRTSSYGNQIAVVYILGHPPYLIYTNVHTTDRQSDLVYLTLSLSKGFLPKRELRLLPYDPQFLLSTSNIVTHYFSPVFPYFIRNSLILYWIKLKGLVTKNVSYVRRSTGCLLNRNWLTRQHLLFLKVRPVTHRLKQKKIGRFTVSPLKVSQ